MSGFWNHDRYCDDALSIKPAVTTGRLYHLSYGFPAMFDATDGQVFGEVMTFPDIKNTLARLDRLEGYRPGGTSHYVRIKKEISILCDEKQVVAWAYVYPINRLPEIDRAGLVVPDGQWRELMRTHSNTAMFDAS